MSDKRPSTAMALVTLLLAALMTGPAACQPNTTAPSDRTRDATAPLEPIGDVGKLRSDVQQGVCLAHNWQHGGERGYGTEASRQSKLELRDLGVEWVSLTPFGFQRSITATEIEMGRYAAGESDDRLRRETAQAHEFGMKVMLKPHLWLGENQWRGHIQPEGGEAGWDTWFASYTRFIVRYAVLAEELHADAFVIGVELASSSMKYRDRWIKVIDAIRAVYKGPLTYAANWNEAEGTLFWDKLDWIGIQFFAPIADTVHPTPEQLAEGVKRHLDAYEALSRKVNKKVIFTEVGYKSIAPTAISPGTWPEHLPDDARRYDERAQAEAFRAVFNDLAHRDFIAGAYIWKWFTDVDTDEEDQLGFSPRHKSAARVIGAAFGGEPQSPPINVAP